MYVCMYINSSSLTAYYKSKKSAMDNNMLVFAKICFLCRLVFSTYVRAEVILIVNFITNSHKKNQN